MTEKTINKVSRRKFVQLMGGAAVAGLAAHEIAVADGHAKLNPEDPQATALGYVEDAANADTAKFPNFAEGSMCSKCALFSGDEGADFGPCGIFPGKEVSSVGWCSAFAPKG